jgi:outer membrane protein insertion porin family
LVSLFTDKGLRDAQIVSDTVYDSGKGRLMIKIVIDEGKQYYFGDITWVGNSKYRSTYLGDTIVDIKKGDPFSQGTLDSKLFMNPNGSDVTSLYMDNGFLFFNVDPVEKRIYNDTIDYEMRISEGKVARVRHVIIKGNVKTNDHVIRREIRTKPGDLFNRNDIIRTQRELSQLNLFDPEKFGINPMPDPATGTVDIEYTVEEKPSDQVELSGGWGGGRVIGTVGLVFNNFSARKLFRKGAWQPLPAGDGQQLSLRAQSNGFYYQGYNFSFVEPWMFGKKANSFSINGYYTVQSNGVKRSDPERKDLKVKGVSVGFGKRLKWPDDFFSTYKEVSFQYYDLNNYGGIFSFSNGYSNNLSFRYTLSRNSIDQPLYPRNGSNITLSLRFTPPYSLLFRKDIDFTKASDQEKYKWLEYHKWKFTTSHFISLSQDKKLVLNIRTGFGFLFSYNKNYGSSPFERFYLGGSGLQGLNFIFAREIVALRGYDDNAVAQSIGGLFVSKYTMELRYPLSLNPNATIYGLAFTEAGNTWNDLKKFNPFQVKRAAGVGVRIFLPMFGLLGLDYGWSFDQLDAGQAGQVQQFFDMGNKGVRGQFHFTIGMNLGEL